MSKNTSGMQGGIPSPRITPDILKMSKTITCSCGNITFKEAIVFKKISAIVSPTGKEEILPIDIVICEKCGKINKELIQHDIFPEEASESKQSILLK